MSRKLHAPKAAKVLYTLATLLFCLVWLSGNLLDIEPFLGSWYPLLLIPALVLAGLLVHWMHRQDVQQSRDEEAAKLEEDVHTGTYTGPYLLYLRPFSSTGQIRVENPTTLTMPSFASLFRFDIPRRLELERVLSDALAEEGPLIALGKPGEYFGAGRLPAEEKRWQEIVMHLSKNARGILVLPSDQPGTRWEIEWLRRGNLLPKCVFLMPPTVARRKKQRQRDRWLKTVLALKEIGMHLPDYWPCGLLLTFDSDGLLCNSSPLELTSEEQLRSAVIGLLSATECVRHLPRYGVIHLSTEGSDGPPETT